MVTKPGNSVDLEDVKQIMRENDVAIYKWPERVEVIGAIPRNPVGKALKAELRKMI